MSRYVYNEHDQNQVREILKNRRLKRRKKRRRILATILVAVFIIAFFVSDLSKIQSINVKGNNRITKEEIINASPAKAHETVHFFASTSSIEKKIKELPAVTNATVTKDFLGNITITVEETKAVAYQIIDTKVSIIDEKGNIIINEVTEGGEYQKCPKLTGFDENTITEFAKEYAKIPSQVQNQVSDIKYAPLPSDELRCEFMMDDGKVLYLRIDDMATQLSGDRYDTIIRDAPGEKYYDFVGKHCYMWK